MSYAVLFDISLIVGPWGATLHSVATPVLLLQVISALMDLNLNFDVGLIL